MNIISQMGFGHGKLKVIGGRGLTKKFVLPPLGQEETVRIFTGSDVKNKMSFNWFLVHVICEEKPELCPGPRTVVGSSGDMAGSASEPQFRQL